MRRPIILAAILAATLGGCAAVNGNYSGGIIPWSPEAELAALDTAQNNCARYKEYAVITSVHREYGDYIAYACQFYPPLRHIPISRIR